MIIGFDLKKTVEDRNIYQAILQLLTGDPMSQYELIQVLTDLRDEWHFFWFENRDQVVSTTLFNCQQAISFLEMIVQETISHSGLQNSQFPLSKNRKSTYKSR